MLQYSVLYCNKLQEAKLYRNTKLYCDSGLGAGRWLGAQGAQAGRAGGAFRRGAGRTGEVLGAQAAGAGARKGARTAGSDARGARGVRSRGAAGARPGRWARGLALGSALGALGPFSIRFDSFFFLSHQMNTVHCKIKFFRKKK